METKKRSQTVLFIAMLLILSFIWGQSCASTAASAGESRFVTDSIIRPIIRAVLGEKAAQKITENLIRKVAHVAEYTVLGLVFGLLLRERQPRFWPGLLLGLAAAFLDETLQIFTGRGSMITDIWIDLIGIAVGGLIALLFRKTRKNKEVLHPV